MQPIAGNALYIAHLVVGECLVVVLVDNALLQIDGAAQASELVVCVAEGTVLSIRLPRHSRDVAVVAGCVAAKALVVVERLAEQRAGGDASYLLKINPTYEQPVAHSKLDDIVTSKCGRQCNLCQCRIDHSGINHLTILILYRQLVIGMIHYER